MNIDKLRDFIPKQNILYTPRNADPIESSSEGLVSDRNSNKDTISISDEAKDLLAEHEEFMGLNENLSEFDELLKELRQASKTKSPYDALVKCMEIATRIIKGHNVPDQDMKFLAENQPKMYSNAILLRQVNDDPKDYDSILEDEENEITAADESNDISLEVPRESPSGEEV